ncbi:hypothetical protein BWQ96_09406 [Gracilariopsis chorda]|uniref:Uncharacterized protein n=1 Tax=Gracilariopsis chorda TaxID=448386 RepID=A0A2V3IFM4_9FLOR|nr:hypothetical protein BWQ96_09406 [Gracilariopsis chorda]|eukprot:PXF40877.1 hypothetical protein BWQ96_09406 [Gracilariopsis chorda]
MPFGDVIVHFGEKLRASTLTKKGKGGGKFTFLCRSPQIQNVAFHPHAGTGHTHIWVGSDIHPYIDYSVDFITEEALKGHLRNGVVFWGIPTHRMPPVVHP